MADFENRMNISDDEGSSVQNVRPLSPSVKRGRPGSDPLEQLSEGQLAIINKLSIKEIKDVLGMSYRNYLALLVGESKDGKVTLKDWRKFISENPKAAMNFLTDEFRSGFNARQTKKKADQAQDKIMTADLKEYQKRVKGKFYSEVPAEVYETADYDNIPEEFKEVKGPSFNRIGLQKHLDHLYEKFASEIDLEKKRKIKQEYDYLVGKSGSLAVRYPKPLKINNERLVKMGADEEHDDESIADGLLYRQPNQISIRPPPMPHLQQFYRRDPRAATMVANEMARSTDRISEIFNAFQ